MEDTLWEDISMSCDTVKTSQLAKIYILRAICKKIEVLRIDTTTEIEILDLFYTIETYEPELFDEFLRKNGLGQIMNRPSWTGGRISLEFPDDCARQFFIERLSILCNKKYLEYLPDFEPTTS